MTYEDFKKKQQARTRQRTKRKSAPQRAPLPEPLFHLRLRADATSNRRAGGSQGCDGGGSARGRRNTCVRAS